MPFPRPLPRRKARSRRRAASATTGCSSSATCRAAAPRRDPDPGGPPRTDRAPGRARVLDPAASPEDPGGVARPRASTPCCARPWAKRRSRWRAPSATRRPAPSSSSPGRRDRGVLLPRGQHAAPGGAPGHRGSDGHRPGAGAAADRGGRAPGLRPGRHPLERLGHRGAPVRRGPAADFLPATGTLVAFEPASSPAVRWDSGVATGSVIGTDFDPMLAKVIAHAPTRAEAAGRLALALERTHLGGVTTNRDFLVATLRTSEFLDGDTTTDFIERVAPARSLAHSPTTRSNGSQRSPLSGSRARAAPRPACWLLRPVAGATRGFPTQKVEFIYGDARSRGVLPGAAGRALPPGRRLSRSHPRLGYGRNRSGDRGTPDCERASRARATEWWSRPAAATSSSS